MFGFLQKRCQEQGLSLADVAKEVGVSPTTVWRWQKNKYNPRWSTVEAILAYLDDHRV